MIRISSPNFRKWRSPVIICPNVTGSSSSTLVLNHNLNDEYVHVQLLGDSATLGITSRYGFYEGDTANDFNGWDWGSQGSSNTTYIRMFNIGLPGRDLVFDVISYN